MDASLLAERRVPSHVIITLLVVSLAIALAWWLLRRAFRDIRNSRRAPATRRSATAAPLRRHPPTSLVALLREPFSLDESLVADAVEKAWGVRPTHDESDAVSFVQNPTPVITSVQYHGNVLAIIAMPEPYAHDRDWYVRDDTPSELITAWHQHRAWLSVDLVLAAPPPASPAGDAAPVPRSEDLYTLIARLLAALVPGDDGLAVFRPAKRHAIVYDDETRTLLRRTNPLHVVTGPTTSLVLLLAAPRQIQTAELLAIIRRGWGAQIGADPSLSDFASAPHPPHGVIQFQGMRLGLVTVTGSYVGELTSPRIADVRIREAVAAHRAWLSIDMMESPVGLPRAKVYQRIARLIAELINADALLLVAPELQRALPVSADLAAKLRADDPLALLLNPEHPPVLDVTGDDPRMAAAIAEARRRLPDFIAAFRSARQGGSGDLQGTPGGLAAPATSAIPANVPHFAVKKRFAEGALAEYMWLRVTAITGEPGQEVFSGPLDNAPFRVRSLRIGDAVSCPAADLVDWLYTDGPAVHGNFTGPILADAHAG